AGNPGGLAPINRSGAESDRLPVWGRARWRPALDAGLRFLLRCFAASTRQAAAQARQAASRAPIPRAAVRLAPPSRYALRRDKHARDELRGDVVHRAPCLFF